MNGNVLFAFEMLLLALLLLLLSKKGGSITNIIVLIPFIKSCSLAFNELEPILYAEKIILYNDWNRYNGIIIILVFIFLGGAFAIVSKIFNVKNET